MAAFILVLCSLPPLAVMGVAVLHGFRTGSTAILSMLLMGVLIFSAFIVVPLAGNADQNLSVTFQPYGSGGPPMQYAQRSAPSYVKEAQ